MVRLLTSVCVFPIWMKISSWSNCLERFINDSMLKIRNLVLLIWDHCASLPNWIINLRLSNRNIGCDWIGWSCWLRVVSNSWAFASSDDSVTKVFIQRNNFSSRGGESQSWTIHNKGLAVWQLDPFGSYSGMRLSSR